MIKVREETTLAELREAARARIRRRDTLPPGVLNRTVEVGRNLADLLERGNPEPYEAAVLLGEILNNVMDAAVLLKLDLAGCITLASGDREREAIPA
jgi:hypothetical protein